MIITCRSVFSHPRLWGTGGTSDPLRSPLVPSPGPGSGQALAKGVDFTPSLGRHQGTYVSVTCDEKQDGVKTLQLDMAPVSLWTE